MPSPLFNFRLKVETAQKLRELAVVFNGGNPSAMVREMVEAIVSGDPRQIAAFNSRLVQKMGEQLALDFAAQAEEQGRKMAQQISRKATATVQRRRRGRRAKR